jgi:DNA-directed RNA polymerase subunit RPC12/RpoP
MSKRVRDNCAWCKKHFIEGDADVLKDNIVICSECSRKLDEALTRRPITIDEFLHLSPRQLLMLCD